MASALDLSAWMFAKTDEHHRAVESRGRVRRPVRFAHAQRRRSYRRSRPELLTIAREAKIRAEIYHLKTAGRENWPKMEQVFAMVEKARSEGLHITADTYMYPAGSTGLDSTMPPWVEEGGFDAGLRRLKDPATRARIAAAMRVSSHDWENMFLEPGSPGGILLVGFKSEKLKPLTGKTLADNRQNAGKVSRRDRHGPHRRG